MSGYIPHRADIVWLNFTPQAGREITKRRPALIISGSAYNEKTKLALCCPITSNSKGYPFEVSIPDTLSEQVKGVILADQIKSLDWQARQASFICKLPLPVFEQAIAKIRPLLYSLDVDAPVQNDLLESIKSYAPNKSIVEISLGIDCTKHEQFQKTTSFLGYLISEANTVVGGYPEDRPDYFIPDSYQTQRLYYSATNNKLLVYVLDNLVCGDPDGVSSLYCGTIYELKNVRNFVSKYPELAKQVGLPIPLPPDWLPIDEAIADVI